LTCKFINKNAVTPLLLNNKKLPVYKPSPYC
jgi:hypothetical protein